MTPNQKMWAFSRDQLANSISSLSYPKEFADLLAEQLGSPKAIDRLASYGAVRRFYPIRKDL